MNADEAEAAVKTAIQAFQAFEEQPSMATAKEAEWKLSILKLMIQPHMFDQLPAFERALMQASAFVEKAEEAEQKAKKQ